MGSRLDQVRARLLPAFRRGLDGKLRVLGRALADHRAGDPEALDTIRRIAHQLRGTGSSYGLPAVSVAGAAVENAPAGDLEAPLRVLLRLLHRIKLEGAADPIRVLCVDDDPDVARLASDAVGSEDVVVLHAPSAADARAFSRSLQFDAIVLDLRLPDADGRDLLEELCHAERPGPPVIVLTARAEVATEAECRALGAVGYLTKPVDLERMASIVASATERTARLRGAPTTPHAPLTSGHRILLADDDPFVADAVRAALGDDELDLTHCYDGQTALRHAELERFSLVVLDGQMSPGDGFQVLEALRSQAGYRRTPILMLTSRTAVEDVERAFALGADDYVEKPFEPRELRARITRLLARRAADSWMQ